MTQISEIKTCFISKWQWKQWKVKKNVVIWHVVIGARETAWQARTPHLQGAVCLPQATDRRQHRSQAQAQARSRLPASRARARSQADRDQGTRGRRKGVAPARRGEGQAPQEEKADQDHRHRRDVLHRRR